MKPLTYKLLKLFLLVECVLCALFYFLGDQGFPALLQLKKENQAIVEEIAALQREITQLSREIDDWHTYPYYKEKIAREQLQMMSKMKNETVYIFD